MKKKNQISKFLYKFIIDKCKQNKTKIAQALSNIAENVTLDEVLTKKKAISVSENFLSNLDKLDDAVIKFAQEKIDRQKTINNLLPEAVVQSINNGVNEAIDNSIKTSVDKILKEELVKSLILNNEGIYNV